MLYVYGISPVITVSETEVWAATLTADFDSGDGGCWNERSLDKCSDETVLTDDEFTYEGVTYTITEFRTQVRSQSGPAPFIVHFDGLSAAEAKAGLEALTLEVGDYKLAFGGAWTTGTGPSWRIPAGFTKGQKYSLSIARTTTKPPKPAGLSAEGGLNMATLRWTDPGYSSSIAKQQYRQKEGAGAWGTWTDIPNSVPGRANAASYTVAGLKEGATYAFQVRAVNGAGEGPESDQATVTMPTNVWTATLTVDKGEGEEYGCSNSDGDIDNCSTSTVLTDNDFDYSGAAYTVKLVELDGGSDVLSLSLDGLTGAEAKTALSALTLWVDGRKHTVSSSNTDGPNIYWRSSLGWSNGQKVSLVLTQ